MFVGYMGHRVGQNRAKLGMFWWKNKFCFCGMFKCTRFSISTLRRIWKTNKLHKNLKRFQQKKYWSRKQNRVHVMKTVSWPVSSILVNLENVNERITQYGNLNGGIHMVTRSVQFLRVFPRENFHYFWPVYLFYNIFRFFFLFFTIEFQYVW